MGSVVRFPERGRSSRRGKLIEGKPESATAVVSLLLDHCREALTDTGDADTVTGLLTQLLTRGNGATFQRTAYRRSGDLTDVIRDAVAVTETG